MFFFFACFVGVGFFLITLWALKFTHSFRDIFVGLLVSGLVFLRVLSLIVTNKTFLLGVGMLALLIVAVCFSLCVLTRGRKKREDTSEAAN